MNSTESNETLSLEGLSTDFNAVKANQDQMFLIGMGGVVLFMQSGFALIEAGTVRAKNATSILIKNVSDMCFGAVAFWACGFAFAFTDGNPFIGFKHFFAVNLDTSEYAFMFFQGTFAATCATIISGAIAERSDYDGYVIFSVVITGFVYPVQTHWCWGPGGWLAEFGYVDFAGSGVVHLAGGVCALVACIIIGPRLGRYKAGEESKIDNHSVPFIAIGFFVLVVGFLAFNGGSKASISNPGDGETIALVFYGTVIAGCAGGIVALLIHRFRHGYWKLTTTVNGGLAGMISICAGCDVFYPWSSAAVGAIGGLVYVAVAVLIAKAKIDDPIDAVAVHGGAGAWGLIASPLFRFEDGIFSTEPSLGGKMLLWNVIGLAAIVVWNAVLSFVIFSSLKRVGRFRVSEECEIVGLDIYKHGEIAYPECKT